NIIVAKALLVGLVAGAAVEEPDAVPRRMHQKLTLMDRPDAIGGEIDIVSGEPSGQYAVGAERQIKRCGAIAHEHHRELDGETVLRIADRPPHAVHKPAAREAIHPTGTAILGRFPLHQQLQVARVATVDLEARGTQLAHEPALVLLASSYSGARSFVGNPM